MSRYALNSALAGLALAVFVPLMAFAQDPFLSDSFAYGPYDKGKKHGEWIERDAAGNFAYGPYVKGKKDGEWSEWDAAGNFAYGHFVDDKKSGKWIKRDADGIYMERLYGAGVPDYWRVRGPPIAEAPFDERSLWVRWVEGGIIKVRPYDKGKKDGEWIERDAAGNYANGPYVDGERHGMWFERFPLVVDPQGQREFMMIGEMIGERTFEYGEYNEYEVRVR